MPQWTRSDSGFDDLESDYRPLSREQARVLRQRLSLVSPWRVIAVQAMFGLLFVALAWLIWGASVGRSVAWGVAAVVLPAVLFARGLAGGLFAAGAGGAVLGFFVWEFVKVVLAVAILVLAQRVESSLNWPALLVGLVLTLKVVWVALVFRRRLPMRVNV
ncbi:MAG: hypothetical protein OHK0048_01550 [Rhodoferax sp.]